MEHTKEERIMTDSWVLAVRGKKKGRIYGI